MTKTLIGLALTVALFGGIVLADDGNMGSGGYTGCDGNNPPPTCCDPATQNCNQGGFASTGGDTYSADDVDSTLVAGTVTSSLSPLF
ncbi:MAG TPA: hypothetical protein VEV84_15160 [Pyrinomonadaceae bacterium]|nr:hypothetical protein [Pyrinomonadaceae bacterium]